MTHSPFPPGPPTGAEPQTGAHTGSHTGPHTSPPPYAAAPGSPYATPTTEPTTGPTGPTGDREPRAGLPYHLLLRGGWPGTWWRALIGIAALGLGMIIVAPLLMMVPFALFYLLTGAPVGSSVARLVDLTDPSPAALAYLNLTLAALIPVAWLVIRYLHGLRPRWLSSIRPRLRWRFLVVCVGLSFVALIATVIVSALLPAGGSEVSGELNELTPRIRDFVLVVLLLTPLQAAAEEYAFRGYLLQAFGGFVRHPAFAVGLSSLLFALAHGAQDAPIFFDRFAFGVVAGTLVIVTGGLEAGIAMHVLNNWFAFGAALAYGDMGSALNPSGGTWWSIPTTLTQSLVYLALAWWVARRMGLGRRSDPAILAAPDARV